MGSGLVRNAEPCAEIIPECDAEFGGGAQQSEGVTAHPGFGRRFGKRFCGELSDCKRMIDMVTGDSIQTADRP